MFLGFPLKITFFFRTHILFRIFNFLLFYSPSGAVKTTTLPNGMKVVTDSTPSPIVSMHLNVNTGSRYEAPEVSGISSFLQRMLMKSTYNRTTLRLVQETGKLGMNIATAASRDNFAFTGEATVESIDQALGTIADLVLFPIFDVVELEEEMEGLLADHENRKALLDVQMNENIHSAAFGASGLGAGLYGNKNSFQNFSSENLLTWHHSFFTPNRMVLSAVGVDHDAFVALATELFEPSLPNVDFIQNSASKYVGGEVRVQDNDHNGLTHFAVGFKAPSWKSKDVYTSSVLQTLLGGGGSFSAGGPGKGLYSRLYTNLLCKHQGVESANSFNSIFEDAGLFGVYVTADPAEMDSVVNAIVSEATKLTKITDEELARAKNQLKSTILMNLEVRANRAEDMARHVALYGNYNPAAVLSSIESVTAADVERVATEMLKSPISSASYGQTSAIPRYDLLQKAFK